MNLATATIGATEIVGAVNPVQDIMSAYRAEYARQPFSHSMVNYNIVQDYMESGGYTNTGTKLNNPGNMIFANQTGASKGPEMPNNKGYFWANFANIPAYVHAKFVLLNKQPGMPIQATTGADFVHRLAINHYFGNEPESSYAKKMRDTAVKLGVGNEFMNLEGNAWDNAADQSLHNLSNPVSSLWAKFRALPLPVQIGAGAAGGLIVIKLLK
jgi:hypothetical protein